MVPKLLDSKWLSRAGNGAFLVSVVLFVARLLGGWSSLTVATVVLLAVGIVLLAVAHRDALLPARRPKAESAPQRLADLLRESYDAREAARHARDRQELHVACQRFNELQLAAENLLRQEAPEYASDFQDASTAPWALQGKAQVLALMDVRLRVHSEIAKRLREDGR